METTTTRSVPHSKRFTLDKFEGPLDLLLFLIKKNEINIYDIPIAQITEQYLHVFRYTADINLDEVSDFHAMAANLLYIKSRMLIPAEIDANPDFEAEDPRADLVEKLIEYQKFKKLSELMEERERELEWIVERHPLQRPLPFIEGKVWDKADVWDLLQTFSDLMLNIHAERIIDMYEEVSIHDKITLIEELLRTKGEFRFSDLVIRKDSVMDIVCAFLAILEAVKIRLIQIYQNRLFGDILIRRHEKSVQAGVPQ
ncbi:segregation and condensation protein A [Breznakiellaceae bacterium SP9]